jgi:hypothetical protein
MLGWNRSLNLNETLLDAFLRKAGLRPAFLLSSFCQADLSLHQAKTGTFDLRADVCAEDAYDFAPAFIR